MPPQSPAEFQLRDWALVAVALSEWAGNPNELETPTEHRAYELIEAIAATEGLAPSELVASLDTDNRPD